MNTVIRRPEVEKRTGLKTSSIYQGIANGTFPKQVKIGAKAVGWLEADITSWIEQRIAQRDAQAA